MLAIGLATVVGAIGGNASAACTALADVLPVPLPNAEAAATIRTGVAPNADTQWVISGTIHRCVGVDSQSAEITTPREMGVTRTAAVLLAISGVQLIPESQLVENRSTEWRLNSVPTARIAASANTDGTNRILISWDATFVNIVSYQLSYTLYLTQK